ncbi:putative transposon, En/Spm-like protein [Tanacetum coccineum]
MVDASIITQDVASNQSLEVETFSRLKLIVVFCDSSYSESLRGSDTLPFLSTARAKIDVYKRKIALRAKEGRIVFTSVKPASSLIKRVYMLSLRERMELNLEVVLEDMDAYRNEGIEFVDDTDFDMDFGLEIRTNSPAIIEMVNAIKESFDEDDLAKFRELLLDAENPLYKGCPDFTKLSAIVKVLNLKDKFGASDKFFTELLGLLKKMLPAGKEMIEKTYQAKKLMRMMGSGYKKIHVSSNNCNLYWKDNKELTVCATCRISRWKVDNKTHKVYENIPAKVMWYFPIIPRMQRLFKLESISEDLRWHATRRITDGVLRHHADSQAWRTIDEKFPKIAKDLRNLWLGISADGVDVNSGTRHHSVWPVLSIIYNLPPWLCMKRKFIILSVLISGYLGNDIDVFLEPLVDDLHTLFETGIDTYDASTKENFNMRAVVL